MSSAARCAAACLGNKPERRLFAKSGRRPKSLDKVSDRRLGFGVMLQPRTIWRQISDLYYRLKKWLRRRRRPRPRPIPEHDERLTVMLVPSAAHGKPVQFQTTKRTVLAVVAVTVLGFVFAVGGFFYLVASLFSGSGTGTEVVSRESVVESRSEIAALREENRRLREELDAQIRQTQDRIARVNRLINRISTFTGLPLAAPTTATVALTTDTAALGSKALGRGGPLSHSINLVAGSLLGHGPRSYAKILQLQLFELDSAILRLEQAARHFAEQEKLLATTPLICPVRGDYVFTDRFGPRIHPLYHRRDFHQGLDIAAPRGTPIIAPADGTVIYAGYSKSRGRTLTIDHGIGLYPRDGVPAKRRFKTRYFHCSKILVKKGAKVKRGDVIALVGSTGISTGNHLHYEVLVDGKNVDPEYFILDAK